MASIESSGYPLVFKVADETSPSGPGGDPARDLALRVRVRALEGMQKEAIVSSNFGSTWRIVSDEGPYLDGTDLAPFPLAFYTAGMQFSFLSELVRRAPEHHVDLESCRVWLDNYYTMEGSALRGTMLGGAKPAELTIKIESGSSPDAVRSLVEAAEDGCAAQAIMRGVLANTFSLDLNARSLPVTGVEPSAADPAPDPEPSFAVIRPAPSEEFLSGIITKLGDADKVFGVEGGAGSSLQAEQRRTLHVHGEAGVVEGLLMETVIRLFKPIGSTFRLLSDETAGVGGRGSAPPPQAYTSAGVGFCYMTQLGRYAHITKQDLRGYRIVQDNVLSGPTSEGGRGSAAALPFDTRVFLETDESEETAQKTLSMGERTCFLHAAMRAGLPSIIRAELNGELLLSGR